MGTILASAIITKAQTILQDPSGIRWGSSELLDWLNDGQEEIVQLRPSAFPKTISVQSTAGSKQTLPTDGYSLIRVLRYMGASPGTTPGNVVREISMPLLDLQRPAWHADTQVAASTNFCRDTHFPKVFYLYPPSTGAGFYELQYSTSPPRVSATGNPITLDDIYENVLLDYMLYRAFSKDMEVAANAQRAMAHRQSFENTLGLKAQADQNTGG